MGYAKLFNDMVWSFSRIKAYEDCPYAFYRHYVLSPGDPADSNFYAENGSLMHEVIARYLSGDSSLDDAVKEYSGRFDEIAYDVSEKIMENTYNKCMDYLCETDGLDRDRHDVLMVEQHIKFKIGKYKFQGFVDCVLKDKESGKIILLDHKSEDHFFKKDGTVLKSKANSFMAYKKQMYIYCVGLKETFGINVDKIAWHHFKDGGKISAIDYSEDELNETVQWVFDTIGRIKKDKDFLPNKSYMMCYELCGYRNDCEYKGMLDEPE